jgi:hypothetical protein
MGMMLSNMVIAYHYYFRKSDNKNANQKRYDASKKRTGSELKPLIDSDLDLKDE